MKINIDGAGLPYAAPVTTVVILASCEAILQGSASENALLDLPDNGIIVEDF